MSCRPILLYAVSHLHGALKLAFLPLELLLQYGVRARSLAVLLPGSEWCTILVSHRRLNLCLDLEKAPTGHQRCSQWQPPASPLSRAQLCLSHRTCPRDGIFAVLIGNKCNTVQKLNRPRWHPAPQQHKPNFWLLFVCWIGSSHVLCFTASCFHFLSGGHAVGMLFINAS